MQVGQAIVSSTESKKRKKSELISRSKNIDDNLAKLLCDWSPYRCQLAPGKTDSVNFFRLGKHKFVLARNIIGGFGYSRDHGRPLITHAIVFDRDQLIGYQNNVVLLARVVRSMGLLTLQTSTPDILPDVDIPERSFHGPNGFSQDEHASQTERIVRALDIHRRVIILGLETPLSFMCAFLAELPLKLRMKVSFATGLNVIDERYYSLQFFPKSSPELEKEFARRQLRTISIDSVSVPVSAPVS